MGKKVKVGKQRKDQFYNLAKQQGYRARSAYKLTQIGNKFNLFDDVSFVIDLCAAPGGWMQVARQSIPMAGHVFGVDLCSIKAIKGCTSIQADITTSRCEKLLNEALNRVGVSDKKVDLVLHDGAPNVGSNWERDAYNQNDLVLKSLQLATKYLKPKGTFLTKVFRSADYTKLLYVFEQLFTQVTPTKPSSSREVSAEIFVVCKGYKAPNKISGALFDVAKVFEDVEEATQTVHGDALSKSELISKALIPVPEKARMNMGGLNAALSGVAKKNRKGYEAGDDFRKCTIRQFFESAMPAHVLVHHHVIEFNKEDEFDQMVFSDPSTTDQIKECLSDLKLVGKGDLRVLLKWRLKFLKDHMQAGDKTKEEKKQTKQLTEEEKLNELLQKEAKSKLRALRKARSKFRKLEQKIKMASAVFEAETEDPELFMDGATAAQIFDEEDKYLGGQSGDQAGENNPVESLTDSDSESTQSKSDDENDDAASDSDTDYMTTLERELEEFHQMKKESNALEDIRRQMKNKKETRRQRVYKQWAEEMQEFMTDIQHRSNEAQIGDVGSDEEDEVDIPEEFKRAPASMVQENHDSDDAMSDGDSSDADSFEGHELADSELPQIPLNEKKLRHLRRVRDAARQEKRAAVKAKRDAKMLAKLGGAVDPALQAEAEGTAKHSAIQSVKPYMVVGNETEEPETFEEIAEVQALGALMSRKKSRMELIDNMYNRYAFEDSEKLPDWFREDDKRARKPEAPITKELYREYRSKLKEISERPIRKVREAKARKKAREDKSGGARRPSRKSNDGGSRKKGSSGPNVDRRLKKDKRAQKAAAKRRGGKR